MADQKSKVDMEKCPKKPSLVQKIRDWKFYSRADENRQSIHNPEVKRARLGLFKAAAKNLVLLQILFFSLFCYIFGALYRQNQLVHHLNIAFVDYDGGAIGESIRAAYSELRGSSFPTLDERSPQQYPATMDLRKSMCNADFWAALYVLPGASGAIEDTLTGRTAGYDKMDTMAFIWNEARYSTVVDSNVVQNIQVLSTAAKSVYANRNWTGIITNPDATTYSTFAAPWELKDENIQPTTQGSRVIYNTLTIILILIQEFFYLGALNQLTDVFKIYTRLHPRRIIIARFLISATYCFFGALFVTSAIWIFKAGWHVNGAQFILTWLVLWLFAHVNFLTFDVFSAWLPPAFVPMSLITWIVMNITSILLPFELENSFYKWSYAMPAHEVFVTLIDIWSYGCNPVLRYSLPVLFAFEVSSFVLSALGIYRRCHYAVIRAEQESISSQKRLDDAMAFEKKKWLEMDAAEKEREALAGITRSSTEDAAAERREAEEEARDREELGSIIGRERTRLEKYRDTMRGRVEFGPSFGFGVGSPRGDDTDGSSMRRFNTTV